MAKILFLKKIERLKTILFLVVVLDHIRFNNLDCRIKCKIYVFIFIILTKVFEMLTIKMMWEHLSK